MSEKNYPDSVLIKSDEEKVEQLKKSRERLCSLFEAFHEENNIERMYEVLVQIRQNRRDELNCIECQ